MKCHKSMICFVIILITSIAPACTSQISGINYEYDDSIKNVTQTQNKIININSSIQGDLKSLSNEANECNPKNIPWYI